MPEASALPDEFAFNKGDVFFPMVMTFVTAAAGLAGALNPSNPLGFTEKDGFFLEGKAHPEIVFPLQDVVDVLRANNIDIPVLTNSLCAMLINTSYETVKGQNDRSPEFEFFRHLRNAASHCNAFHFAAREPIRRSSWRGLVIPDNPKGTENPLFRQQCFGHFVAAADALVLLWDIQRRICAK